MNIFRKKTTPKDALRTSKREMSVATRGIEREISSLQMEEKRLVAEIKKTAKTGNEAATKILARQLVRLRQQITNLQGSRAQIRGVTTHTQIEMMSEAIDETLDKDEAEEETEDLTNQVLDEIGVGVASQLSSAPKGRIATKTAAPPATTANSNSSESSEVDELEKRLASLRRI
ncbi:Vacuolar protein sorting-associated protein 2-like protein 2 [Raphanus sativus]|nr:Vacuolar protein sorting-associated protein 2-like protein 2 [Raphanus sativus]